LNQNWVFHGLIIFALCWFLRDRVPYIGRLPGDFDVVFGNVRLFLPIVSGLLLSLAWSVIRGMLDGR
jgi:hypothetical protein